MTLDEGGPPAKTGDEQFDEYAHELFELTRLLRYQHPNYPTTRAVAKRLGKRPKEIIEDFEKRRLLAAAWMAGYCAALENRDPETRSIFRQILSRLALDIQAADFMKGLEDLK